jgi:hypothetical protein
MSFARPYIAYCAIDVPYSRDLGAFQSSAQENRANPGLPPAVKFPEMKDYGDRIRKRATEIK